MKTDKKPMNKLERILCTGALLAILTNEIIQFGYVISKPGYSLTDPPFYETSVIALALASIATISYHMRSKK